MDAGNKKAMLDVLDSLASELSAQAQDALEESAHYSKSKYGHRCRGRVDGLRAAVAMLRKCRDSARLG